MPLDEKNRKEIISAIGTTLLYILHKHYDIGLIGISDSERFCSGCDDSKVGVGTERTCLDKPCLHTSIVYRNHNNEAYAAPLKENPIIMGAVKHLERDFRVNIKPTTDEMGEFKNLDEAMVHLFGDYKGEFFIFSYEAEKTQ